VIDPTDKQTAALPLEQPKPGKLSNVTKKTTSGFDLSKKTGFPEIEKRGRGRPATGAAMTPAEKQRAYRQRLADQKKSQVPAVQLEKVRSTAAEYLEKLGQQLADAKAETAAAIARAEEAEANFVTLRKKLDKALSTITELRANKGNVTEIETDGMWTVQRREQGKKAWKSSEPEAFKSAKDSVDYMQFQSGSGQHNTWRAVRADGMMYWPKAPKRVFLTLCKRSFGRRLPASRSTHDRSRTHQAGEARP